MSRQSLNLFFPSCGVVRSLFLLVFVTVDPRVVLVHAIQTNGLDCDNTNHNDGQPPSLSPLQVFLLAGQSNMVGQGDSKHLKQLLDDPLTHDEYARLWDVERQEWATRDDVFVSFYENRNGKLSPIYGEKEDRFGPELGFGWTVMDDYLTECDKKPILLLKTAWGGRNIAVDFRSPSSGKGDFRDGVDGRTGNPYHPIHYGWQYRIMIDGILQTLENDLPNLIPEYENNYDGYVLKGLVWFQGWNDMIVPAMVDEYASNLANLIRDIRMDLDVPALPVVIGELGAGGDFIDGDELLRFREKQRSVTELDEFKDNTVFVPTAKYVVTDGETFNGSWHYFGRADTFFHIGTAFADAMASLLRWEKKSVETVRSNDPEDDAPHEEEEVEEANVTISEHGGPSDELRNETFEEKTLSEQANADEDLGGERLRR